MKNILIVDDEPDIRAILRYNLEKEGFSITEAVDGNDALDKLSKDLDLAILDIMMPGKDGYDVCRKIREQGNTLPIVFLTAMDREFDEVKGLEVGADDYLPKPFNPRELLARIKAVLRRQVIEAPGAPSTEESVVEFGEFRLNLGTREMFRGEEPMPLTSGEFAVLKSLVTNAREPMSRDKLMNMARGREYSAMERSIDVQISRLRRLVEEDPSKPRYIQTVWGLGYVFVPDGKAL